MSETNSANGFDPERIAETLMQLPKDLYESDRKIVDLEGQVNELKESLELAEVNASLNGSFDGKNEKQRDLQRAKVIASDAECIAARTALSNGNANLEYERANNKQLSRRFAGLCHLAELKAAQLQLMAKGMTR